MPKWLTSGDLAEYETRSKLGWDLIKRVRSNIKVFSEFPVL